VGNEGIKVVTFIDWSDAEGMFGLLVDFVADERAECRGDVERLRFLENLVTQLRALEAEYPQVPAETSIQRLKDLHDSADTEFADDPVFVHLDDCIDELERVSSKND